MRLKPKTPMELHNAEQPEAVLADLEAKHGSSPTAGWTAWRCPHCGWANNRQHEGLDACEKCKADVATYYSPTGDALNVKWHREPERVQTGNIYRDAMANNRGIHTNQ